MRLKAAIWLIVFLFSTASIAAQKVKVVTKITERSYEYKKECLLEISAEKANITISPSKDNNIHLILRQIVKNLDENIAKKEMNGHRFVENKDRQRLYLRNYIMFDSGEASKSSIFKTEYVIEIPVHCHIKVSNQLGNTTITEAQRSITTDIRYGELSLINCISRLDLKHTLGEISIQKGIIDGTSVSNNTNIKLQNTGGILHVQATMGSFNAYVNNNNIDLEVETKNCETTIINRGDQNYTLDFECKNGEINIPEIPEGNIIKKNSYFVYEYVPKLTKGTITVDADFCNINYY